MKKYITIIIALFFLWGCDINTPEIGELASSIHHLSRAVEEFNPQMRETLAPVLKLPDKMRDISLELLRTTDQITEARIRQSGQEIRQTLSEASKVIDQNINHVDQNILKYLQKIREQIEIIDKKIAQHLDRIDQILTTKIQLASKELNNLSESVHQKNMELMRAINSGMTSRVQELKFDLAVLLEQADNRLIGRAIQLVNNQCGFNLVDAGQPIILQIYPGLILEKRTCPTYIKLLTSNFPNEVESLNLKALAIDSNNNDPMNIPIYGKSQYEVVVESKSLFQLGAGRYHLYFEIITPGKLYGTNKIETNPILITIVPKLFDKCSISYKIEWSEKNIQYPLEGFEEHTIQYTHRSRRLVKLPFGMQPNELNQLKIRMEAESSDGDIYALSTQGDKELKLNLEQLSIGMYVMIEGTSLYSSPKVLSLVQAQQEWQKMASNLVNQPKTSNFGTKKSAISLFESLMLSDPKQPQISYQNFYESPQPYIYLIVTPR